MFFVRSGAICPNQCNNQGTCDVYDRCSCFKSADNEAIFTGADCSLRTCPKGVSWIGSVVASNNVHPMSECSNKGLCDRRTGYCACFENYEGIACERTVCPNDCSMHGECYTQKQLASEAKRVYASPWDANKHVGCVCDAGYRGYDCSRIECPSGSDPLLGYGNEAGRECSGRGICQYQRGTCACFQGFAGPRCDRLVAVYLK